MKKIVSLALVLIMLFGCMSVLTSCNTFLFGTYTYTDPIFETKTTYEFTPLNKVKMTAPALLGTTEKEGTYKITESTDNPGTYVIIFTWNGETEADSESFAKVTENGVEYIKIGGIKLVKE